MELLQLLLRNLASFFVKLHANDMVLEKKKSTTFPIIKMTLALVNKICGNKPQISYVKQF